MKYKTNRPRCLALGILDGFALIFIGSMIYVLWRGHDLLMFSWFRYLHFDGAVMVLRDIAQPFADTMPSWFYYSLPNALWLFGGLIILSVIWGKQKLLATFWCSLFALIAFGGEFCQSVSWLPGTFDITDVTLMGLAAFIAFPIYVHLQERWHP